MPTDDFALGTLQGEEHWLKSPLRAKLPRANGLWQRLLAPGTLFFWQRLEADGLRRHDVAATKTFSGANSAAATNGKMQLA